jgi:glycerophosphoryl diester phosphodiesterase
VSARSSDRPLVFAHRGSSQVHAEHTLDAYLLAIEQGADGLECDVRLTRDGHLVCVHDPRLDRVSNGRGRVSTLTLAQLDELDFGSWHSAMRAGVLTLERLLSVCVDAGRPIELLIETKHPTRHGAAVEAAVVKLLSRFGLDKPQDHHAVRASVMSFSPSAVRRVRQAAPDLPAIMLIDAPAISSRTGWLPFGCTVGAPGIELLRTFPELVHRMHRRGHRVYVWTVNLSAELDLAVQLDVDGIISDRPDFVAGQLRSRGLRP